MAKEVTMIPTSAMPGTASDGIASGSGSDLWNVQHAFSVALRDFVGWCEDNPDAAADEVWSAYWTRVRLARGELSSHQLALRVHPAWRERLAVALARAAAARLEIDPFPHPDDAIEEIWLWEAARGCSIRTVQRWQNEHWLVSSDAVYGYPDVRHRLADLYLRAGRCDRAAVSLYIEVFTGPAPAHSSTDYSGGHYSPSQLIERGARIEVGQELDEADLRARYGLCLRLAQRRFAATWVAPSLQQARQDLPEVAARMQAARMQKAEAQREVERRAREPHQEVVPPTQPVDLPGAAGQKLTFLDLPETQTSLTGEARQTLEPQLEPPPAKPKRKRKRKAEKMQSQAPPSLDQLAANFSFEAPDSAHKATKPTNSGDIPYGQD